VHGVAAALVEQIDEFQRCGRQDLLFEVMIVRGMGHSVVLYCLIGVSSGTSSAAGVLSISAAAPKRKARLHGQKRLDRPRTSRTTVASLPGVTAAASGPERSGTCPPGIALPDRRRGKTLIPAAGRPRSRRMIRTITPRRGTAQRCHCGQYP